MNATTAVLALDALYWPVAGALTAAYLLGRTTMSKKQPTPEAQALLDQARADYNSPKAHQIRQNLGWDAKDDLPVADFDADGILRDGSDG